MNMAQATKVSKEESLVLIKNMIRISISSICYFRDLFPSNCYKKKQYGAIEIHQLQGATKDERGEVSIINQDAFLVTQWLERGVFMALENEYVSSMTFAIYAKDAARKRDVLLETYQFQITYPTEANGARINEVDLNSKEAVKNQAAKLIRSLTEFTATLEDLPHERWMTIELKYRDNAPADYQPEFFCDSPEGFIGHRTFPLVVNIGGLKTSQMEMKLKFAGLESLMFEDLSEAKVAVNPPKSILAAEAGPMKTINENGKEKDIATGLDEMVISEKEPSVNDRLGIPNVSAEKMAKIRDYMKKNQTSVTAKKLVNYTKLNEAVVKAAMKELKAEGTVYSKGGYYYYTETPGKTTTKSNPEPSEKQFTEETAPAMNETAPTRATGNEPFLNDQSMMFSQSSEKASKARKFSVIKDPLQVFQEHKRSRT